MARFLVLLAVVATLVCTAPPLGAQEAVVHLGGRLHAAQTELDTLREGVKLSANARDELIRIEGAGAKLQAGIGKLAQEIAKLLAKQRTALKDIGPKPSEPGVTETADVVKQRNTLTEEVKKLEGFNKHATALTNQTLRMLENVGSLKRSQFFAEIFSREQTPFAVVIWSQVYRSVSFEAADAAGRLADWYKARAKSGQLRENLSFFTAVTILFLALFGYMRIRLRRYLLARFAADEASDQGRAALAGALVLIDLVVLAGFARIITRQALVEKLIAPEAADLAFAIAASVVILGGVISVCANVRRAQAFVTRLGGEGGLLGARAFPGVVAVTLLFVLDLIAVALVQATAASVYVTFAGTIVFVLAASTIMLTTVFALPPGRTDRKGWGDGARARVIAGAVCTLAVIAELMGFLSLGRYLIRATLMLTLLWAGLALARAALHEGIAWSVKLFSDEEDGPDKADDARAITSVVPWFALIADIVLLFWGVLFALMVGGLAWSEVSVFLAQSLSGIKVGSFTISTSAILSAISVFILAIVAARLFQNYVRARIFPSAHTSVGIQESIITVIRYSGLVIAVMMAVVTLGVDFSNIAIIAGALSVGIGFGLQSIANNFISGLILLFERPIKVGDWVVTTSGEGMVKKIGVRSTEIETFDRSSLLIPNSEFITATVQNWTHRSRMRRVDVPVGVSYDADPEAVKDLLFKAVFDLPKVLKSPEPQVLFLAYGDSSINFGVRVFIRNASDNLIVRDAIYQAVWDALKAENIEIPYPQRDIHIRSHVDAQPAPAKPAARKSRTAKT